MVAPEGETVMRVGAEADATAWVVAVNGASPHTAHRQNMLSPDQVQAALSKAQSHSQWNAQVHADMVQFVVRRRGRGRGIRTREEEGGVVVVFVFVVVARGGVRADEGREGGEEGEGLAPFLVHGVVELDERGVVV